MSLLSRIAGWAGYEKRAAPDPSWAALGSNVGYAAGVSARAAENLATVLACTNAVASALGSVPALVYRRDADGNRTEMSNHPLARLVRIGPNEGQTWPDFVEHMLASTLLAGNAIAVVERAGNGQLAGLRCVPWSFVTVAELSSGRLAYDVSDGRGRTKRYLEGETIHLRDRTDDGRIGRSRLSRARDAVAAVQAANETASSFLENKATPGGIIEVSKPVTEAGLKRLRTQFSERYEGASKAGRTLILDDGATWKTAQISPEDAELLETRKFGVVEICRIFGVPPPIVQAYENNTFTNASQAGLWFATFCLAPWARKIEAEFARSVFPVGSGYELEIDLSGFLRGDPETRWKAHEIAVKNGILDPDEIRQVEGWNARKAPENA